MKKFYTTLIVFTVSISLIQAQEYLYALISRVNLSASYKGSFVINSPYNKLEIIDTYIGYKFKQNWSMGLNTGIYRHNDKILYYNTMIIGIGFRYFMFQKEKYYTKPLGLIPYLNINYAMTNEITAEHDYFYYDVGIKTVYPKFPLFFVGIGFCQNFYFDERNSLIAGYLSVGLRF